ncbi:HAMP domain-containing histidine kinase, partial [bacterium]|nr:HAMP domain-containing histidine kinase [bacterium]
MRTQRRNYSDENRLMPSLLGASVKWTLLLITILSVTIAYYSSCRSERELLVRSTLAVINSTKSSLINSVEIGDYVEVERLLGGISKDKRIRAIYLIDQNDIIDYSYPEKGAVYTHRLKSDLEHIESAAHVSSDKKVYVVGDGQLIINTRLQSERSLKHWRLIVSYSLNKIRTLVLTDYVKIAIVIVVFACIIYFGFLSLLNRRLTPLRRITEQIGAISNGDYNIPDISPTKYRRLAVLVNSFNKMKHDIRRYSMTAMKNAHMAAIGRTSAMIAHDVRKPFAQMKSVLEMLPDKKDDDAFMDYASQQVHEAIRKADAMMSDILEYSRDVKLELNDVGVVAMLASALGDVFKNSGDADVAVEYGYKHSSVVHIEEMKIARVFTNIIANAVDAMSCKGKISIQMRDVSVHEKNWVDVIIANDGPKIPEDALPHLFEPFFTKGKKSGTGLGLAI